MLPEVEVPFRSALLALLLACPISTNIARAEPAAEPGGGRTTASELLTPAAPSPQMQAGMPKAELSLYKTVTYTAVVLTTDQFWYVVAASQAITTSGWFGTANAVSSPILTYEPLAKLRRVETGVSVSRDSALSKCAIPLNFVGFEDHEAGRDGFSHPSDKPVAFSSAIMRRVDGSRSNIRRYVTRRSSCRAVKPSTPNIRWHITLSAPRTRTVRPPWLSFTPPLTRSAVLRSP